MPPPEATYTWLRETPRVGRLLHDLDQALDITDAGERNRSGPRRVGDPGPESSRSTRSISASTPEHFVAVHLPHVGAKQLGEQPVALSVVAMNAAIQHHHDVQTRLARRRRALARMVGLAHAPTPHEGVAPLLQGLGHLELELPILVAAQGAVRQVVALDEHPRPADRCPQVAQLLERRGQVPSGEKRGSAAIRRRRSATDTGTGSACPHACRFPLRGRPKYAPCVAVPPIVGHFGFVIPANAGIHPRPADGRTEGAGRPPSGNGSPCRTQWQGDPPPAQSASR